MSGCRSALHTPDRWQAPGLAISVFADNSSNRNGKASSVSMRGPYPRSDSTTRAPESIANEDLERVLAILASDIPAILQKDPNWDIFADEFKVINQAGGKVESLELNMLFVKLLRIMHKRSALRDNIWVNFTVAPAGLLVSHWQVQLSTRARRRLLRFWSGGTCVNVEAETVFHLNDKNKLDYMKVNKWLVNGQELRSWPDLKLSDTRASNIAKLEEWGQEIRTLAMSRPSQDEECMIIQTSATDDESITATGDASVPSLRKRRPGRMTRFVNRFLNVVLDRVVDRLLDRVFERVGQQDLDRVVDRVLDRILDRASDRTLGQVWNQGSLIQRRESRSAGRLDARDGLQADLPNILSREPNWAYVADDFKLMDQTGFMVQLGVTPTKGLLYLLRQIHNGLTGTPLRDKLSVQTEKTFEPGSDGAPLPVLMARWILVFEINEESESLDIRNLEELRAALLPFIPKDYGLPITVAGQFLFKFNNDRELDSMQVDSWSINGNELKLKSDFPFLEIPKLD